MKKIIILSIICSILLSACGINAENNAAISDNMSTSSSAVETDTPPTASPITTPESTPTISPATIAGDTATNTPEVSDNAEDDLLIYGKWKIIDRIGEGYTDYGIVSMDDYVDGIITIDKDYIESDIPLEKTRLENPRYEISEQSRTEFYMNRPSDYSSFGFKDDKRVTMIKVYDDTLEYDDLEEWEKEWEDLYLWEAIGNMFWIKDKDHIIIMGPVFFLAERME